VSICRRWTKILCVLLHVRRDILILIDGDEVNPGRDSCLPAWDDGVHGAEVVVLTPALIFIGVEAVESVEADPEALLVSVVDECAKAVVVDFGPFAGVSLSSLFDDVPGVVPPATVGGWMLSEKLCGRDGGFAMVSLLH